MSRKASRSRSRQRYCKRYYKLWHDRYQQYHDHTHSGNHYYLNNQTNNNYYYDYDHNHSHHNHNHNHSHHHYHHHHYSNHRYRERERDRFRYRHKWTVKPKAVDSDNKNEKERKKSQAALTSSSSASSSRTRSRASSLKIKNEMKKKEHHENENETENENATMSADLEGTVNLRNVRSLHRGRYTIVGNLGHGTFCSVVDCIDNKRKIRVAVKIVRSVKRYLDAAEIEVDILNELDDLDVFRNSLIIRLYKSFRCMVNRIGHNCLVFEKCGSSLYDYIKKNKYQGFPLSVIGAIAYQLLHAISFCHLHKLTHTDLKLENILFLSDDDMYHNQYALYLPTPSLEIRLIDFGGATFQCDHHSSIINTRQYRGPEVILKLKWSYPSDIWSIGCILAELYCGELLFATQDDVEHLQLIQKILHVPQFPRCMMNHQNQHLFPLQSSSDHHRDRHCKTSKYVQKCKRLNQIIQNDQLCHLIEQCLQIDPNKRITASQAKKHPFFHQFADNVQFQQIYQKISTDSKQDSNQRNRRTSKI